LYFCILDEALQHLQNIFDTDDDDDDDAIHLNNDQPSPNPQIHIENDGEELYDPENIEEEEEEGGGCLDNSYLNDTVDCNSVPDSNQTKVHFSFIIFSNELIIYTV